MAPAMPLALMLCAAAFIADALDSRASMSMSSTGSLARVHHPATGALAVEPSATRTSKQSLVRRESHQKGRTKPKEARPLEQNSLLEKGAEDYLDTSGAVKTTVLSVVITGAFQKELVNPDGASPAFSVLSADTELDSTSRWDLTESREHPGSVYIQSASLKNNHYLHDTGSKLTMALEPHSWDLEDAGDGRMTLKSAVTGSYLIDSNGVISRSNELTGCSDLLTGTDCDFKIELLSVAWGRSVTSSPSNTTIKVYLTGDSGKNLKNEASAAAGTSAGGGALAMDVAWNDNEVWNIVDCGDSRSFLKGAGGEFLHNDHGTLKIEAWDDTANSTANDNNEWFLAQVEPFATQMYLRSNDGKFLVDESGEAVVSTSIVFAEVGKEKRFSVILQELTFVD